MRGSLSHNGSPLHDESHRRHREVQVRGNYLRPREEIISAQENVSRPSEVGLDRQRLAHVRDQVSLATTGGAENAWQVAILVAQISLLLIHLGAHQRLIEKIGRLRLSANGVES